MSRLLSRPAGLPGEAMFHALTKIKTAVRIRTRVREAARLLLYGAYNAVRDFQHGADTGGAVESPFRALGLHSSLSIDYLTLERIFSRPSCAIGSADVAVDVGCGKGRVSRFWMARFSPARAVGLEIDEHVARVARRNLVLFPHATIVTGDAIANLPVDGTLFFLFNPFDEGHMRTFRDALKAAAPSGVRIVYHRCLFGGIFEEDPAFECERFSAGWLCHGETLVARFRGATHG